MELKAHWLPGRHRLTLEDDSESKIMFNSFFYAQKLRDRRIYSRVLNHDNYHCR
jgi:hypothetical protein